MFRVRPLGVSTALVAAALAGSALGPSPASAQAACNRTAASGQSAQALVDSLEPGQTGCLSSGSYREDVKIETPRTKLQAVPGQRASLHGRLWVAESADGTSVEGLYLDGGNPARLPSPTVNASDVSFRRNDVTNDNTAICFSLGHRDYGRAMRTTIESNRIHNCGQLPVTNHHHGIYVTSSTGARIRNNWIYDNADRGVQLYPDAQNTTVEGNVIDGNGQGVIFSGDGGVSANGNRVEGNVIANSKVRNNVESFYPSGTPAGRNNSARRNCVGGGARDNGDAGIADTVGFVTSGNLLRRPDYSNRGARDLRLVPGSACGAVVASADHVPGPDGLPAMAYVTMKVSRRVVRRGARVAVRGRVVSQRLRRGMRVELLAKSGRRGRRIARMRVNSSGRFSARPRLSAGRRARVVTLRARVRSVGASRSVRLRLRSR